MNGQTEEEEVQAPAAEPAPTEAPAEPKPLSVDISEDADEDEQPQQQANEPRPVRHKSDWRKMKERYESDVAELRRELAEMKGRMSAPAPVQQHHQAQPTSANPVEAEITSLSRQQDFMLKAINGGNLSDQDQGIAIEEWRKLDRRRRALEHKADVGEQRQVPQVQSEDQMIGQLIRMEFPQVFEDDELRTRAEAEMIGLMKRGRARSLATAREACQRVSKRTGLFSKPPEPTNAERARYSSVPARAGANGASGQQYTPSKMVLEMARGYTSHHADMSDEQRVRKWVKEVGRPNGLV